MNFVRSNLFFLVFSAILFVVPFFWFGSGEVNLGGDSSRLYFYDPIHYITSYLFWNVAPSDLGGENISYFLIPFTFVLWIIKLIIRSPSLLINLYHGMSLMFAFVFTYLSITVFFKNSKAFSNITLQIAAAAGGLFYALNPILGTNFDKALISQSQFFLNPLMFFFLFSYIHSRKFFFLVLFAITSIIFSGNFAYASAPALFAFYPLTFIFLFFYSVLIQKKLIKISHVIFIILLIVGLHSYQLVPQIGGLLDEDSPSHNTVFSSEARDSASSYFISIAKGVILVNNFLVLNQSPENLPKSLLNGILPTTIILGLLLQFLIKKVDRRIYKLYLLLYVIFLFSLFFATANVTPFGLVIYKWFFILPGFEMFRNYYGQFAHVFFFYYSIIFGFSLVYLFHFLPKKIALFIFFAVVIFLVNLGTPLITGELVNWPIYQSKNIRVPHKIDSDFEDTLAFIRSLPDDGKFLTLPLTAYGYQVIAGTDGGVYKGPSMIGYLTGKKDFTGFAHTGLYTEAFLNSIKRKDTESFLEILSLLNIKYIYYNSDPYIYNNFNYPYDQMKEYFPTQNSISKFISILPLKIIYKKNHFEVFEITSGNKTSHAYSPQRIISVGSSENIEFFLDQHDILSTPSAIKIDDLRLITSYSEDLPVWDSIPKDFPSIVSYPFVRWDPELALYPMIVLKEEYQLAQHEENTSEKIDSELFFAAKRVAEIKKWGEKMPTTNKNAPLSNFQSGLTGKLLTNYGSWEVSFLRYEDLIDRAIQTLNTLSEDSVPYQLEKTKIYQSIKNHRTTFKLILSRINKTEEEKNELKSRVKKIFDRYEEIISVPTPDLSKITYSVTIPESDVDYSVFVKSDQATYERQTATLLFDNYKLPIQHADDSDFFIPLGELDIKKGEHRFSLLTENQDEPYFEQKSLEILDTEETNTSRLLLDFYDDNLPQSEKLIWFTNFEKPGHYFVSFEYDTLGSPYLFGFYTKFYKKNSNVDPNIYYMQYQEEEISNGWEIFNSVMYLENLNDAYALFKNLEKSQSQKIKIRNVRVKRLPYAPAIIFKQNEKPDDISSTNFVPIVESKMINPTRYTVNISNASEPYVLVFSDKFDNDWKLYNKTDSVVSSIFSKPIADERHFQINGYANAWNIEPGDFYGVDTYEILIEKKSQYLFYIGSAISIVTLLFVMVILVRSIMSAKSITNRFGGERLDSKSTLSKNNMLEHLARYKMMKGDKRLVVLDIGSGEGHGSKVLAEKYKKVVGVDISEEAVSRAKKFNKKKNVEFFHGSATKIPLKDNSIDAVAAFEIIEHIRNWKDFLAEIRRVVKKEGVIYISTPNKAIYNPYSKSPINPHHIFEWQVKEFLNALSPYFTIKKLFGQRTPVYNDHWVWRIVDPLLFSLRNVIPYKLNNTLKLSIINAIKPNLHPKDIVFSDDPSWIKKSRTILAYCKNKK